MKRLMVGVAATVLVSGGLGLAGVGLAPESAARGPGPAVYCTNTGVCSYSWCPGQPLPQPDVKWDMGVCHEWFSSQGVVCGGTQVGWSTTEGRPAPEWC
jgi:hypothetical protein